MPINIYIECTQIAMHGGNTGIQRVERNITNYGIQLSGRRNINVKPVMRSNGRYIVLDELSKTAVRDAIGYFGAIREGMRQCWRVKHLTKQVFPFAWVERALDAYWHGAKRFVMLVPLLVVMMPIVGVTPLVYAISMRGKQWIPGERDVLLVPGSSWWAPGALSGLESVKDAGGKVAVVICDLFPITHSHLGQRDTVWRFQKAILRLYSLVDLVICISRETAKSVRHHLGEIGMPYDFHITHFRLGAELDLVNHSAEVRAGMIRVFQDSENVFLSVGTIEPRKNYGYLLDAFDILWAKGSKVTLVIAGGHGWLSETLVKRIQRHSEYGGKLFWWDDLSDAELMFCYKNASALVYPSLIEGFGLPLIEALREGCLVLASDIPVFHEIGQDYCAYFNLRSPDNLVSLINEVIHNGVVAGVQSPSSFHWPDWEESSSELYRILIDQLDAA